MWNFFKPFFFLLFITIWCTVNGDLKSQKRYERIKDGRKPGILVCNRRNNGERSRNLIKWDENWREESKKSCRLNNYSKRTTQEVTFLEISGIERRLPSASDRSNSNQIQTIFAMRIEFYWEMCRDLIVPRFTSLARLAFVHKSTTEKHHSSINTNGPREEFVTLKFHHFPLLILQRFDSFWLRLIASIAERLFLYHLSVEFQALDCLRDDNYEFESWKCWDLFKLVDYRETCL